MAIRISSVENSLFSSVVQLEVKDADSSGNSFIVPILEEVRTGTHTGLEPGGRS